MKIAIPTFDSNKQISRLVNTINERRFLVTLLTRHLGKYNLKQRLKFDNDII